MSRLDPQEYCANCSHGLEYESVTYRSQIYNPDGPDFNLCESCGMAEEDEVDQEGTNDIPGRLAHYRKTIGV